MQYRVRIKGTNLYSYRGAHTDRRGFSEGGDLFPTLAGARANVRHHREVCEKFGIVPQDLEVVEAIIQDGEVVE